MTIEQRVKKLRGLVISDKVSVHLNAADSSGTPFRWELENMKLIKPPPERDPELEVLEAILAENGIVISGEGSLGGRIWQVTLRDN